MTKENVEFINKEISWLSFNERVLQEATDPTTPLLERIKFLGIFSSNLDEFFRVRVATLRRLANLGKKAKKIIGHDPHKILKRIQKIVLDQQTKFDKIYQQILKELAGQKIFIIDEKQLNEEQGYFVKSYFRGQVRPKLIPIMLDGNGKFPDLRDKSVYLAICLSKKDSSKKNKYALIEIPSKVLPRFVILPGIGEKKHIILLDDVIRYGLEDIFSIFEFDTFEAYTIKLTRDAELDIDEDVSESYIRKVHKSLKQRKEGQPVRFVYDCEMPKSLFNFLIKRLNLGDSDAIIPGAKYHNFKDFFSFPDIGSKSLRYKPLISLAHKDLQSNKSLLATIKEKDILLHFPYQSFDYIIDLLREASIDPSVTSIKITLYRVARYSSVVHALINAVKNGKAVTVVVELQARFDEEANINMADKLQEEGAKVIHGVKGLKVHAKCCLITRKNNGKPSYFAIIGTGNFNEETARIYSDHSLFTANRKITREVARLFDSIEQPYNVASFKHLLISPFHMRKKLMRLIKNEINNAEEGKDAYLILKLNNITDFEIIARLYEASRAGVRVKIINRGMFSVIPNVEGMSESIEAISIVDKYLEHTRIFVFCNDGDPLYFLSSADWMTRNFDKRIEAACPVYDKKIQRELREFLEIQWQDNVKSRILDRDLQNVRVQRSISKKVRAQNKIYEFLKDQLRHDEKEKTEIDKPHKITAKSENE
jgi:polyphosphate kinase